MNPMFFKTAQIKAKTLPNYVQFTKINLLLSRNFDDLMNTEKSDSGRTKVVSPPEKNVKMQQKMTSKTKLWWKTLENQTVMMWEAYLIFYMTFMSFKDCLHVVWHWCIKCIDKVIRKSKKSSHTSLTVHNVVLRVSSFLLCQTWSWCSCLCLCLGQSWSSFISLSCKNGI